MFKKKRLLNNVSYVKIKSGLWQENGPCRSTENGTQIEFNPYTWTQHSNMLFIDQVSGVIHQFMSTHYNSLLLIAEWSRLFLWRFKRFLCRR